ncbi:MAG: hypothetical protein JST87_18060 [Bacteroidetes bacterium]|nr:hypothetical protein [Bacteroidota bacterium]MBS1932696.1 hypothetical protein [Bacteroidota bacterium]
MKNMFMLAACISFNSIFLSAQIPVFIDPTGTYTLKGDVKNNRIMTTSGEIRVLMIDSENIAIYFFIAKGYPGYESASFTDTLHYTENKVEYKISSDADCSIMFSFRHGEAEITQTYSDPQGCDFGKGILTSSVFEKSSAEKPVIKGMQKHDGGY